MKELDLKNWINTEIGDMEYQIFANIRRRYVLNFHFTDKYNHIKYYMKYSN